MMTNRIVLVSDDPNYFDYLKGKLELRKSDELFTFKFDEILDKIHLLKNNVLIINSELSQDKTLALIKIFKSTPIIVTAYNDDDKFKKKCYHAGIIDFMSLLTPDAEFRARTLPALKLSGILEKNEQYRALLVDKNIIDDNNEVFKSYEEIIETELKKIRSNNQKVIFGAISPSDKAKLKISSNNIETIILNNIRKNDVLMSYAPNKYFIFLKDTDLNYAIKLWNKINQQMPQKIYAGLTKITNQNRQQLINEALNKLHQEINNSNKIDLSKETNQNYNFKIFKQDFIKKFEQVVIPTFYQIQQNYESKLSGINIKQFCNNGEGEFSLTTHNVYLIFKITAPGFSKINIDIIYQLNNNIIDQKRIPLEIEEFTGELLYDLLEQFILEFKGEYIK